MKNPSRGFQRLPRLIFSAAVLLLAACTAGNPDVTGKYTPQQRPNYPIPPKPNQEPPLTVDVNPLPGLGQQKTFEWDFAFFASENTAQQDKHNENTISAFFQVIKEGHSVSGIKPEQLRVTENEKEVRDFKLAVADRQTFNRPVDIMFLVDVTRSMGPFIENAKRVLTKFIQTSRQQNYHTRMCVGAFGDYLVKVGTFQRTDTACTRFYDNNPSDRSTDAQVRELLNELSKLRAARGSEDPGGNDFEENPMGALIGAAKAPWGADSQRFVIVVTDAGFLYSPDKQGAIGTEAPTMAATNEALKAAGLKVFAVTPSQAGYNSPFQDQPSIVEATGGRHYEFSRVNARQITLDSILGDILKLVNTTYKVSYIVEKNGLDPQQTVEQRRVVVQVDPSIGQIGRMNVQSSMPTGRPQYKDTFEVADSAIAPASMKISVNNQELESTQFTVTGTSVRFNQAPAPGARLKFQFMFEAFEKNIRLTAMTLPVGFNPQNSAVMLNGVRARSEDISLAKDNEGLTNLSINDSVLAAHDPYSVRANQRLKVKVVTQ